MQNPVHVVGWRGRRGVELAARFRPLEMDCQRPRASDPEYLPRALEAETRGGPIRLADALAERVRCPPRALKDDVSALNICADSLQSLAFKVNSQSLHRHDLAANNIDPAKQSDPGSHAAKLPPHIRPVQRLFWPGRAVYYQNERALRPLEWECCKEYDQLCRRASHGGSAPRIERKATVDTGPELSLNRQAELLTLSRASLTRLGGQSRNRADAAFYHTRRSRDALDRQAADTVYFGHRRWPQRLNQQSSTYSSREGCLNLWGCSWSWTNPVILVR